MCISKGGSPLKSGNYKIQATGVAHLKYIMIDFNWIKAEPPYAIFKIVLIPKRAIHLIYTFLHFRQRIHYKEHAITLFIQIAFNPAISLFLPINTVV